MRGGVIDDRGQPVERLIATGGAQRYLDDNVVRRVHSDQENVTEAVLSTL